MSLREGPIYTTATRPSVGQINRYAASLGALVVSLPALADSSVGAPIMMQKDVSDTSSNVLSFVTVVGDAFDDATTAVVLSSPGAAYVLQVVSLSGVKYWKVMGFLPGTDALTSGVSSGISGGQSWLDFLQIGPGAVYQIPPGSVTEIK